MLKKLFLLLFLSGPIWGIFQVKFHYKNGGDKTPMALKEATFMGDSMVQIYETKEENWVGALAVKTWLVAKPKYAVSYTVYEIAPPKKNEPKERSLVSIQKKGATEIAFPSKPRLLYELKGKQAEKIIDQIDRLAQIYPYQFEYEEWFGPNQNTFVAYLVRNIEGMDFAMPSNANGKDYLGLPFYDLTPTKTGYQISYKGMIGMMLSKKEGIEVNIGGIVIGVNPASQEIKLPGFGTIAYRDIFKGGDQNGQK